MTRGSTYGANPTTGKKTKAQSTVRQSALLRTIGEPRTGAEASQCPPFGHSLLVRIRARCIAGFAGASGFAHLAVGGFEDPVEVGAAVAEEAPCGARAGEGVEVEGREDDAFVGATELRDLVAAGVGDERRAVEALAVLGAGAVRGDHGHHVR